MESKIALLMKIKQWKEDGIKRAPLVEFIELLIPCILHLENRVGEKIITMILQKGFDLWSEPKKKIFGTHRENHSDEGTWNTGLFHSRAKMTQS
jgi:hypothetical protein